MFFFSSSFLFQNFFDLDNSTIIQATVSAQNEPSEYIQAPTCSAFNYNYSQTDQPSSSNYNQSEQILSSNHCSQSVHSCISTFIESGGVLIDPRFILFIFI